MRKELEKAEEEVQYTFKGDEKNREAAEDEHLYLTVEEVREKAKFYEAEMKKAAKEMRFEDAARFRDQMRNYRTLELTMS